jgi:hypothetical protein
MRAELMKLAMWIGVAAFPASAVAQENVAQCTVTEIKASNDKGGVDARLDKLKAKLGKPPFASYDTFKLLGEQTVAATRGKPAPVKLVNGSLTLLFKDKLVASGGKARLRFGIDVDDKQGARTISTESKFDSGDPFFIAGQPYDGGTYVLALTCNAP